MNIIKPQGLYGEIPEEIFETMQPVISFSKGRLVPSTHAEGSFLNGFICETLPRFFGFDVTPLRETVNLVIPQRIVLSATEAYETGCAQDVVVPVNFREIFELSRAIDIEIGFVEGIQNDVVSFLNKTNGKLYIGINSDLRATSDADILKIVVRGIVHELVENWYKTKLPQGIFERIVSWNASRENTVLKGVFEGNVEGLTLALIKSRLFGDVISLDDIKTGYNKIFDKSLKAQMLHISANKHNPGEQLMDMESLVEGSKRLTMQEIIAAAVKTSITLHFA